MFGGRFQFTIAFLVLIVVILLYVNGAIWWSTHDTGPFIMDFFDMGNLILGFLFKGWSFALDEHLGTHFFAPVTWWIVDGVTYFAGYSAVIVLMWNLYYVSDEDNPKESFIYKISATVVFLLIYRFHLLDFTEFFKFILDHCRILGAHSNQFFPQKTSFWLLRLLPNLSSRNITRK